MLPVQSVASYQEDRIATRLQYHLPIQMLTRRRDSVVIVPSGGPIAPHDGGRIEQGILQASIVDDLVAVSWFSVRIGAHPAIAHEGLLGRAQAWTEGLAMVREPCANPGARFWLHVDADRGIRQQPSEQVLLPRWQRCRWVMIAWGTATIVAGRKAAQITGDFQQFLGTRTDPGGGRGADGLPDSSTEGVVGVIGAVAELVDFGGAAAEAVVDGHGDLRLEHVHLTDERVCIYDCIEFNERLRHLDVANDIAFLAMDLDLHGRPDFADHLSSRIADTLGDPELDELIDFYKCYRAYVRGKVEGMRADEDDISPPEQAQSRTRAHQYYQWALRYALGAEPLVVVIFGRAGTGKSTQASALAAHLSSDEIRKTRAGVPLHQRTDAEMRDRLYSNHMTDLTYRTLQQRAVARGREYKGTILDATYSSPKRREDLRVALRSANIPYAFVELTASDEELRDRLSARDADSAQASDAREEDLEMLSRRYQAPNALEDPFHVRVPTDDTESNTTLTLLKTLIRLND